jgi:hypothetical protein
MAAGKRPGKKSQASNDFLTPQAPTGVSATDVGTGRAFNNGAASVTFSLSSGATSFTATATAAGQTTRTATGASSPLVVQSLASGVTYSVTVTATNASGTSAASSAATVTATTVPATMSAPTVSSSVANEDSVSWVAPSTGGKSITGYRWESSDDKSADVGNVISVTVAQEGGTAQTYKVRAVNDNGNGEFSPNSSSVTTVNPFFPFFPFFPSFGPYFPYFPFFPSFAPSCPGGCSWTGVCCFCGDYELC